MQSLLFLVTLELKAAVCLVIINFVSLHRTFYHDVASSHHS